jgi:predicted metalloprotease with PDZ domain
VSGVHYSVDLSGLNGHRYAVTLRIERPKARQIVSLPVWIPGSYLVREFSKNLIDLRAEEVPDDADTDTDTDTDTDAEANDFAEPCTVTQIDKCTWSIGCSGNAVLILRYEIYAFDSSVRSAWLDGRRGFFNATSLCLAVQGQTDTVQALTLAPHRDVPHWRVATGLAAHAVDAQGFGTYHAASYDELVDCPVEMGDFWQGEFSVRGVPHRFVVAGASPSFDGKRLLADTQKIVEAEMAFWHGASTIGDTATLTPKRRLAQTVPFSRYVFMLNAVDDGYGGLEHRNSTALICTRRDLPRSNEPGPSEGYTTLLGLISHEYFHTWNVKRLRPAAFKRYDYRAENYTELLWFFEGFTSYYDDLLLVRAKLIDDATYLKLVAKTINQVVQTPGKAVQSVAQSSFDAWIKYYRVDENTPNITVSYYTKGALVAMCFDLSLRCEGSSLDAVMRALWLRTKGGPMTEADFAAALLAQSGRSYALELEAWVHGTGDLPLRELLGLHGVNVIREPVALSQQLGLRVSEGQSVVVKNVLRGSLAEAAGLSAGDECLAVNDWRLHKLDDLPLYAGADKTVALLVSRDKRLMRLTLALPPRATADAPLQASQLSWRLAVQDAARFRAWTDG